MRVQHDEVDHVTESLPVRQIAGNSRQQQGAGSQHPVIISRRAHEIIENCCRGHYCQYHKKPTSERTAFLQLSESNARIFSVDEIEKALNDGAIALEAQRANCPGLGRLIDHVDAKAGEQISGAPAQATACVGSYLCVVKSCVHNLKKEMFGAPAWPSDVRKVSDLTKLPPRLEGRAPELARR